MTSDGDQGELFDLSDDDDIRHQSYDHRSCSDACEWRQTYMPIVARAAQTALVRSGRRYLVVCLGCDADDDIRTLGTFADLWSAFGSRNSHWKRIHNGYELPEPYCYTVMKGSIAVYDGETGELC